MNSENNMKIQLMSDVHLEFSPLKLENKDKADVLILAGDILPVALVNGEIQNPASLAGADWPVIHKGINEFFRSANFKWDRCYMVFGNHEYYHGDIKTSMRAFQDWLDDRGYSNIIIMDNSMETYKDVTFIGTTLWTDLNNNNPIVIEDVKNYMYDYKVIANGGSLLTTEDTLDICKYSKQYLMMALEESIENKRVVITHHAPTHISVNTKYFHAGNSNYGFYSNLGDIILDYFPDVWVHGHMHDSAYYMVGDTRVMCNPRGYTDIGRSGQENLHFDNNFAFVV